MNKIYKIAISEFKGLFYSPIAWVALCVFVAQSAYSFLNTIEICRENISMGIAYSMLTSDIFAGNSGVFGAVRQNLYLYMPLLTMGLMSRETSSGSIKLLLSSPVTTKEIILGKYLAMMFYGLILLLVLVGYCLIGNFMIKSMDIGLILPGLLAIYLLICTYAAIGLYLSCLTSHLVVAAVSTLAVFASLQFIGTIGQDMNFVRELTNALSISGRAYTMTTGLLISTDVIYFLLIIVLFLALSIFKLESERTFKPFTSVIAKYLILLFLLGTVGYLSGLPQFSIYKDMTATQSLTLTESSQQVLRQLDGPLHIKTYVNLLNSNVGLGLPENRNKDAKQLLEYKRLIKDFRHDYVYYYDYSSQNSARKFISGPDANLKAGAEKIAEILDVDIDQFMSPSEIKKEIDLSEEDNRLVRVLSYKGKQTFLRFYGDLQIYPYESEITAAIKRLVVGPAKVAFVTGDNERSISKMGDRDYIAVQQKDFRYALVNQGFDVVNINLHHQEIPKGLSALVLADPTMELGNVVENKLKTYINEGGNLFIAGEPGRQHILNPLLATIGVHLKEGVLENRLQDNLPELLLTDLDPNLAVLDSNTFGKANFQDSKIAFPEAAALGFDSNSPFHITTIASSPVTGSLALQSGSEKGVFPILATLSRETNGKEQKIIVSGDADFISTAGLQREEVKNFALLTWMFKWFSDGAFPIDTQRPSAPDTTIQADKAQINTLKALLGWILPIMIAICGIILMLRRKMEV